MTTPRLRIGLNLLYLIPDVVGGTETYARGLLSGFKQIKPDYDFVLFLNRESAGWIADDEPGYTKVICPVNAENRKNRYCFEQIQLRQYVEHAKIDLLHSLAYTSPLFLSCPAIVTIPDLNFKAFGNSMPLSRRLMLGGIVRQAVKRSSRVVTISEFSRREILAQYPIPSEKLAVTHLAAECVERESKTGEKPDGAHQLLDMKQPYAVAFSSVTANKNLTRMIEAFLEAKRVQKLTQKLILIGHELTARTDVKRMDNHADIHWTGYLQKDEVDKILRGADFLIFPSLYEGFGLPVLEAMAAGVPVVCSHAASLPEVAGDAGIFFNPLSVADMAAKIAQVATDQMLRDGMRKKGFKNLERFSWKLTATRTLAVYDEILQGR